MTDITIITPTCGRPQQLALVIECINKQILKPDKWIIVDDGKEKLSQEFFSKSLVPIEYIWHEKIYQKSTVHNTLLALQKVSTEKCIIIQDDDYYSPCYIQEVNKILKDDVFSADLIWKGYRLSTGFYRVCNGLERKPHCGVSFEWHSAAFSGSSIREAIIQMFSANVDKNLPPDYLAQIIIDRQCFPLILREDEKALCISLKDYGVGTPGWMKQHRSNGGMTADTSDYSTFKSWLGQDWIRYKKYLGRLK